MKNFGLGFFQSLPTHPSKFIKTPKLKRKKSNCSLCESIGPRLDEFFNRLEEFGSKTNLTVSQSVTSCVTSRFVMSPRIGDSDGGDDLWMLAIEFRCR